jgi:hypothetical protein
MPCQPWPTARPPRSRRYLLLPRPARSVPDSPGAITWPWHGNDQRPEQPTLCCAAAGLRSIPIEPTGRAYPGGSLGPQVTAVTAGSADSADRGYALAAARQGCSGSATIAVRTCPLAANLARTRQSRAMTARRSLGGSSPCALPAAASGDHYDPAGVRSHSDVGPRRGITSACRTSGADRTAHAPATPISAAPPADAATSHRPLRGSSRHARTLTATSTASDKAPAATHPLAHRWPPAERRSAASAPTPKARSRAPSARPNTRTARSSPAAPTQGRAGTTGQASATTPSAARPAATATAPRRSSSVASVAAAGDFAPARWRGFGQAHTGTE